jgi:hypothetical protein
MLDDKYSSQRSHQAWRQQFDEDGTIVRCTTIGAYGGASPSGRNLDEQAELLNRRGNI